MQYPIPTHHSYWCICKQNAYGYIDTTVECLVNRSSRVLINIRSEALFVYHNLLSHNFCFNKVIKIFIQKQIMFLKYSYCFLFCITSYCTLYQNDQIRIENNFYIPLTSLFAKFERGTTRRLLLIRIITLFICGFNTTVHIIHYILLSYRCFPFLSSFTE